MADSHHTRRSLYSHQREWMAIAASIVGLCVFVVVIGIVTLSLRERLRAQIVSRDAAVLSSVAQFETKRARATKSDYETFLANESMEDRLLEALLDVSSLNGVVALRVFDANGNFLDAAPSAFVRGGVDETDLVLLRALKPAGHFHPNARLDDYFYPSKNTTVASESRTVPLLEVVVPIYETGGKLQGVGQFLLDGAPTQAAFAELDRNLVKQAGLALSAAFVLGCGLIGWSFWNLHRGNLLLLARTRELARANRELSLRSRVAALGSITANLLHGLKNPLASLSMYVAERRRLGEGTDEGLADADEAARRMGRMIEESVAILAQDAGDERFDYTLVEIGEVVLNRCNPTSKAKGVLLEQCSIPDVVIDNRRGNLLALAAVNLTQNAVEATPQGGKVELKWSLSQDRKRVILTVADSGCGLPENMHRDPFKTVRSSKKGGSGVGLAIAAQLVKQMDGELTLAYTGEKGTAFSICLSTEPSTFPVKNDTSM